MYSLNLDSSYQYRLLTEVYADGAADKPYPMGCIVDTGCVNTLIDDVALGHVKYTDLGFSQAIRIAGKSVSGRALVLARVDFGGLKADRVLVFAAPLVGTPVANRMLLGLSTLNNWDYKVKRAADVIEFTEAHDLPVGAGTKNRYTNYFDESGKYVLLGE
jgi:hypothetical protein